MSLSKKPLRWDDTAARHDPASLPFWHFYVEMQKAEQRRQQPRRPLRWLRLPFGG